MRRASALRRPGLAAAPLGTSLFAYTRIGVENPLPINFASLNLTFGIACPFASLSNSKIVNNNRNAFTLFGPNGLTWFDASSMEMNKFSGTLPLQNDMLKIRIAQTSAKLDH